MLNLTPSQKVTLYQETFQGRTDVFAKRWEKADGSSSGYTPVCSNEWKQGLCHKLQRKKCNTCPNQNYTELTIYQIEQHLRGNAEFGIYPLLNDNTSFFIAADFDGKNWQKDAQKYIEKCEKYKLSPYLERSRSGNGGHVWIFFKKQYPAYKSRDIATNILREAKIIDEFAKEDSFDRLFPNQDMHSGKGFGNLIALPLQGKSRQLGNTIFLNHNDNFKKYKDPWELFTNIKKVSPKKLDTLYDKFNTDSKITTKNILTITVEEQIKLNKHKVPRALINFLREELNFLN